MNLSQWRVLLVLSAAPEAAFTVREILTALGQKRSGNFQRFQLHALAHAKLIAHHGSLYQITAKGLRFLGFKPFIRQAS